MSKIHKRYNDKTACGILLRWKIPRGTYWYNWTMNYNITTDKSGAAVDCKRCLGTIKE